MEIYTLDNDTLPIFGDLNSDSLPQKLSEDMIAIGAVEGTGKKAKPAGLLVAKARGNVLDIKWLYVEEKFRRKEVGFNLISTLVNAADAEEDAIINSVYVMFSEDDENMHSFLQGIGFDCYSVEGLGQYYAQLSDMKELPLYQGNRYNITRLKNIPAKWIKSFQAKLLKMERVKIGVAFPIIPGNYHDLSMVLCKGQEIRAMILLKEIKEGFEVSWVYSADPKSTVWILAQVKKELLEKYGKKTTLVFGSLSQATGNLTEHLFPKAKKKEIYFGYWGGF